MAREQSAFVRDANVEGDILPWSCEQKQTVREPSPDFLSLKTPLYTPRFAIQDTSPRWFNVPSILDQLLRQGVLVCGRGFR